MYDKIHYKLKKKKIIQKKKKKIIWCSIKSMRQIKIFSRFYKVSDTVQTFQCFQSVFG